MKVYCDNCKYSSIQYQDYPYYLMRYVCQCSENVVIKENAIETIIEYPIITIYGLNKNNDCKNYKTKWWKFWV